MADDEFPLADDACPVAFPKGHEDPQFARHYFAGCDIRLSIHPDRSGTHPIRLRHRCPDFSCPQEASSLRELWQSLAWLLAQALNEGRLGRLLLPHFKKAGAAERELMYSWLINRSPTHIWTPVSKEVLHDLRLYSAEFLPEGWPRIAQEMARSRILYLTQGRVITRAFRLIEEVEEPGVKARWAQGRFRIALDAPKAPDKRRVRL